MLTKESVTFSKKPLLPDFAKAVTFASVVFIGNGDWVAITAAI